MNGHHVIKDDHLRQLWHSIVYNVENRDVHLSNLLTIWMIVVVELSSWNNYYLNIKTACNLVKTAILPKVF